MWPMLSGANMTSPRTEMALSGGPVGHTALIVGRYKLLRGKQPSAFFPGPHMPNKSDTGGNVSLDCSQGCLFDLDADPTEHVDLAQSKPDIAATLARRAVELDLTYFQSEGSTSKDPAAKVAAATNYSGFWGPWQPAGPSPPPGPSPLPPTPPDIGFFINGPGKRCLTVDALGRHGNALLGTCDGGSKWAQDAQGRLYNVAVEEQRFAYLREHHSSDECAQGQNLVLGEVHDAIGTILDNGNTRLNVTNCQSQAKESLCGVPASPWGTAAVAVVLYPCELAAASSWNGQI